MDKDRRWKKYQDSVECLEKPVHDRMLTNCRETIKRLLAFPPDTNMVWKIHDDSIAQRSAIDQARHEKTGGNGLHNNSGKRREPTVEESEGEKTSNVLSLSGTGGSTV